ncbi:hypothetical protein [Burkholderia ubonensis]|uniref:hypothetical protein n=1 Tax=Burkholderia ubonensis TaxID=101571 RepID=UPI000757987B|nr:hypothetical protein [Burkholderia ubonensis]KVP39933.1 hypothetical protein WJ87_07045 [Burkholderia ubonensis]
MNEHLVKKLKYAVGGRIFASVNNNGRLQLMCLGTHEEVRHRYNQMACLIGGTAMQTLQTCFTKAGHSTSAPSGSWFDHLNGNVSVGTPDSLFELATQGPSERADNVGYLTAHNSWPVGMTSLLAGTKAMVKSMGDVGNVFYFFDHTPTAQVGLSQDVSAVKRAQEGLKTAKRAGYAPYKEDELMKFLETLTSARFLHFFHEVNID